jgi:hypothetical protein
LDDPEKEADPARVGLCLRCRHARTVRSRTSLFWMCERSKTDPDFARYPRLPMLACRGFEPPEADADESADPGPAS